MPDQLERFRELPMTVTAGGQQQVLQFDSMDGDTIVWQLANVDVNRPAKGRVTLSKRQQQERIRTAVADINSVRLYLDI